MHLPFRIHSSATPVPALSRGSSVKITTPGRRLCGLCMATILGLGATLAQAEGFRRETLTQVSTIGALLNGVYEGSMPIGHLKRLGDMGLGTFDGLDGEMLMIDGKIHQVLASGAVREPEDRLTTPFAQVTFFDPDQTLSLPADLPFREIESWLDQRLPSINYFYALRLEGRFKSVRTRSVPRQEPPYKPLATIAATQPEFDFQNVGGTMVGFRSPPYVKDLGVPGYHLHFLTADGQAGGHVLDFVADRVELALDQTHHFSLELPELPAFGATDLVRDQTSQLKRVESGRRE